MLRKQSFGAITSCMSKSAAFGEQAAVRRKADNAYVYARDGAYWVYFTRGSAGTFEPRSADYEVLMVCGVIVSSRHRITFLGEPLKEPLIDIAGRDLFLSPVGSTELLFRRANGHFGYCCSQQFDVRNFEKNNPVPGT